jgi:O-antigen ligase
VALVVWAALAVSHIDEVNIPIGRRVRWAVLAALTAVALAYAATRPDRRLRLDRIVWLAAAFLALALASASWSAHASLTLGRAVTLLCLFVAGGAIAFGTGGDERAAGRVLFALLIGAAAVAAAGAIDLAIEPDRALVPATTGTPSRYNGIGGNPNMMAMLLAVCLPLALWAVLKARSTLGKAVAVVVFLGFDASLVGSGSRGALLASAVGLVVLGIALPVRRPIRAALAVGAVALLALNLGLTQIPQRAERNPVLNPEFGSAQPLGPRDAQFILPLESEIGFPAEGLEAAGRPRSLFDTSGRPQAWEGALEQAFERPVLGYGFGTEDRVFVDRFYRFNSSAVENSFLGTFLQLGAVGLGLLLTLIAALAARGVHALGRVARPERPVAAACLGVVATGLVLALTQSYLTSVGNPATTPFWLSAFMLAAVVHREHGGIGG